MIDSKISRISDLCNGKAEFDFKQALDQVIENLNDPKCDAKTVRKINISVSFRQDPADKVVAIEVDTTTKLARKSARRTLTYIGKGSDGQLGLFTDDPDQIQMFNNLAAGMKPKGELEHGSKSA